MNTRTTLKHYLLVFGLMCSLYSPSFAVETGKRAPDFTLPGISSPIQLNAYKGKVVYLDFWASWCAPCKQSFPWMNSLQAKYGEQNFKIIAINVDTNPEDWKKFLETVPAQFDIALDPKNLTLKQYGVVGMPTSFIIDRNGKIKAQHAGFNELTREESEKTLRSLLEPK